jgi:uncharacterized RDD family membrane protein YckC
MTRTIRWLVAVTLVAASMSAPAAAQVEVSLDRFSNPAVHILQNYTLRAGDTARQIVVIGGDARIEGRVTEDVVVVLGKAELASTAVIEGSFVVVAGTAEVAEGAKVEGDLVAIGGAQFPASFSPGGQRVVVGTAGMGESLRSLVPWLTHGLLLGRPFVPWLGWVWMVAGVFFFLNLVLNLIFDRPIASAAATLRSTPFSAFFAGLLVMLLIGPICVLLAVSVIGIVVIPFLLCALVAAGILGRIGFARWIGMSIVPQDDPADRSQSMRSFLIGSALMCVTYMIPFIGILLWVLAGVFGLGAATLAFYSSYRRENPKPPKPAPVVPSPAPPLVPDESLPLQAAVAVEPEGAPRPPSPQNAVAFPKATFAERLGALMLDAIAVAIVAQLLSLDRHGDPGNRLIVLLALVYHVGFWTWRATTPGGMILQLRVTRIDGKKLEFPESLVRGLTGIFSLVVAGLGFLWMLWDPERQTWHDRVAGTYVVKVPRTYPV